MPEEAKLRKPRILFVDQDRGTLIHYRQEFEAEGYEIRTANSGEEALRICEKEGLDAVVTGIQFPGMDGVELMGRIKAENPGQIVIINTAYASYKDNFLSWSADAYVIKSSDLTDLKETVKKLLSKKPE